MKSISYYSPIDRIEIYNMYPGFSVVFIINSREGIYDKVEKTIDIEDFKRMLKEATEDEIIAFFTSGIRLFVTDQKAVDTFGLNGEKLFKEVIPELYEKYRLLLS